MSVPLLVEFFHALPEDARHGNLDWPIEQSMAEYGEMPSQPVPTGNKARRRAAVHIFHKKVKERYTPGTLLRLLQHADAQHRQAAAFALGLLGKSENISALARRLHDEDDEVARLASDAMWNLWFRGDDPDYSNELHRLLRLRDTSMALTGFDALIQRAPNYAEARNQRALLYFRQDSYEQATADCKAVLRLQPHHYGAMAGLGLCFLRRDRYQSALRAFRNAVRINPRLGGIAVRIRTLERALGEDSW